MSKYVSNDPEGCLCVAVARIAALTWYTRTARDCLGLCAPLTREQLRDMARQPGAFEGFFAFDGREATPAPPSEEDEFAD